MREREREIYIYIYNYISNNIYLLNPAPQLVEFLFWFSQITFFFSQASGSQLAERLEQLLAELQGSSALPRAAADPVSAAEHAMRSMHLDPLVEVGLGWLKGFGGVGWEVLNYRAMVRNGTHVEFGVLGNYDFGQGTEVGDRVYRFQCGMRLMKFFFLVFGGGLYSLGVGWIWGWSGERAGLGLRVFWSGEGPCRALRDHHLQKMGVASNNDQSLSFLSFNRLSYEPSRFMGSTLIPHIWSGTGHCKEVYSSCQHSAWAWRCAQIWSTKHWGDVRGRGCPSIKTTAMMTWCIVIYIYIDIIDGHELLYNPTWKNVL